MMMKRFVLVVLASVAVPVAAQEVNHELVVDGVKRDLLRRGVDLSGPCGAFAITKRVAWQLRAEGAGLLVKPAGNNCEGFATDILAYPSGRIVDILGDGGNANMPQWGCCDTVEPSRYRPALDPGDPSAPTPTPTVPLPSIDLSPILSALTVMSGQLAALGQDMTMLQAQQTADTEAIRSDVKSFRDAAGRAWKSALLFATKYVAPVVAGLFAGRAMK